MITIQECNEDGNTYATYAREKHGQAQIRVQRGIGFVEISSAAYEGNPAALTPTALCEIAVWAAELIGAAEYE